LKILDLGLENRLKQDVGLLSGGQRQSLTLLMATLSLPRLLLLDEHTAALDPKTADKVSELTEMMVKEHNLTTLMVTHNMNQALQNGNRMIMLHQGRVQMDVSGEEKQKLTVREVINKFGKTLKDETLLTCEADLP
jgi:putative ABC transport system ATP-binding protein